MAAIDRTWMVGIGRTSIEIGRTSPQAATPQTWTSAEIDRTLTVEIGRTSMAEIGRTSMAVSHQTWTVGTCQTSTVALDRTPKAETGQTSQGRRWAGLHQTQRTETHQTSTAGLHQTCFGFGQTSSVGQMGQFAASVVAQIWTAGKQIRSIDPCPIWGERTQAGVVVERPQQTSYPPIATPQDSFLDKPSLR